MTIRQFVFLLVAFIFCATVSADCVSISRIRCELNCDVLLMYRELLQTQLQSDNETASELNAAKRCYHERATQTQSAVDIYNLGFLYAMLSDLEVAAKLFAKAHKIMPDWAGPLVNLCTALFRLQHVRQALPVCERYAMSCVVSGDRTVLLPWTQEQT